MRLLIAASLFFTALVGASETLVHKSPELAFKIPGQGERLLSQYRGKVVALEFILTTCPHCQAASQIMNKMQGGMAAEAFKRLMWRSIRVPI